MKATAQTRRAALMIEVTRHGQGVTYRCKGCGHTNEANAYYEEDHKAMIYHADQCKKEVTMEEKDRCEEQLKALRKLVDPAFVKKSKHVKGPYVTGEYVCWLLNKIFGPSSWSFTILQGPEIITISETQAYSQVVGRLEITFANGMQAHQDDIGIWPLVASNIAKGGSLETTAAERYETVAKAARTDCLKNCTYNLGTCFGPLWHDHVLEAYLGQMETRASLPTENKTAVEHNNDLFGQEAVHREVAHNAERRARVDKAPVATAPSLDDTVAKYKDVELELPPWVEEIRAAVEAHPGASDPVENGSAFIKQLEISAGRKVEKEQFHAFVQIVLGHPLADVTFGEAAVLMNVINADGFEKKVIGLL